MMSDGPANTEELKNELDIVFKAVWTQQLIDTTPEYEGRTDLVGSPIFYDAAGNLDVDFVSKKMSIPADVIKVSHENWLKAGNKPPIAKRSSAPQLKAPAATTFDPTPVEPQGGSSTIRDATTHYQEVAALNHARNQYEASQSHGGQGSVMGGDGTQALLGTLITELVRSNGSNKSDTDSLVLLKMMEASERNSERSRQDQAMMMNAMNQNNTQMMGLVIDSMRNGGGRSTTDETLIGFALEQMRGGSNTPEESIVDRLISSGQLAEITGSIATGLKSVMSARSPPVGAPPSYTAPPQIEQSYQEPVPQAQVMQNPQPMPEISFEDKCRAVMQQIHQTLPEQWKANEMFIEILKRSTERAVSRAEDMYPASIESQIQRSIVELLIVVNLRLLGTSVQNINKGIVSVEMAGNFLGDHELYAVFENETYDSLMEIITSYIDCDPPGQKNIAYDIEFLSLPDNRQVIEGVLAAAKQR